MGSGQKAMWDEIEEQAAEKHRKDFLAASADHLKLVDKAMDDLMRFAQSNPALTRHQHTLVDDALNNLKRCFKNEK